MYPEYFEGVYTPPSTHSYRLETSHLTPCTLHDGEISHDVEPDALTLELPGKIKLFLEVSCIVLTTAAVLVFILLFS